MPAPIRRSSSNRSGRNRPTVVAVLAAASVAVGALGACSSTPAATSPTTSGSTGTTAKGGGPTGSTAKPSTTRPPQPTKVTEPTVEGPITGGTYGKPFNPLPVAMAEKYGYQEHEYFISGTATSYQPEGTWGEDGAWTAAPAGTAPYTTRIIVRLPTDKAQFNGTVLVEWLNVSSGMDADPDFGFAHDELLRQGYGYMAVSAQKVGIEGGGVVLPIPGFEVKALKPWDSTRYGALVHPGDEYSYDIFSQAGAVTLDPKGVQPFAGYDVTTVLAAGESQSSFRMVSYINAVHPLVRLYDGFFVHSRGPGGAAVTATNEPAVPKLAHIRADMTEPVLQFETETDIFGLGFEPARQPDTDVLRTWEVAGTAHADQFTLDYGVMSGHEWDPNANIDFDALCGVLNKGPQTYVVRAAIRALRAWVVDGTPPATSPRIEVADGAIVRDADGNAKGGIRTAAVDAPTSQLTGETVAESVICSLFGTTVPFSPARLAELYPDHAAYVAAVTEATDAAVAAGFVLADDRAEIVAAAEVAAVP